MDSISGNNIYILEFLKSMNFSVKADTFADKTKKVNPVQSIEDKLIHPTIKNNSVSSSDASYSLFEENNEINTKPAPVKIWPKESLQPPNGKTLPFNLKGSKEITEADLLSQTSGNGSLWAVGEWKPGAKPIIIVHGIGTDFDDIQPIIDKYKNDPNRQILVYAYDDLGEFTEENGKQLAYQMSGLQKKYPWVDNVDIVAHSMGGIVAKRALNELAEGELGGIEKFKQINFVAIDTPWHGFPGPGFRFNIVRGGMDMQAKSEMFTGTTEGYSSADEKGLSGVKLPDNVKTKLLFADNKAAGFKNDAIKDYTDFSEKINPKKFSKLCKALISEDFSKLNRVLSQPEYNFFTMLMQDSDWPKVREELRDQSDNPLFTTKMFNKILKEYMPRFSGEHSGVLGNPALLNKIVTQLE